MASKVSLEQQQGQLERELMDQKSKLEWLFTDVSAAEGRLRTLQKEERCTESLEKMLSQAKQQLSEREQQLMEKSGELLALQKEADGMRADFSLLRNQFLTERKKAEKQVAGLKEALKIQRSQLEKNLLVSKLPWESREKRRLHQPDTHISHLHCFPVEKRNYPSTQALTPMVETQ